MDGKPEEDESISDIASKKIIFHDEDVSISPLRGRKIAIIGYGNQGRSQALNMRDSGVKDIIVGSIKDESWGQTEKDGFDVYEIGEASEKGDILFMLIPDEVAPEVFETEVKSNLNEKDLLNFASGYNITYDFIKPPKNVDVIMVAPRMIGPMVRERYKEGRGAPTLIAVNQDYSGEGRDIALAIAKAVGATKSGAIEGSFEMETKLDLLFEQGLRPILFSSLMAYYELAMEEGIPPETILTELYLSQEMASEFELMAKKGLLGQLPDHSRTSQYGQLSRLNSVLEEKNEFQKIKDFMKKQLVKIDSGEFAREWSTEQIASRPVLKRLFRKYWNCDFIKDEQKTMEKLRLRKK